MKSASQPEFGDVTEELGRGWNRFWFTPADALPSCVLRILVGLLATAHFLLLGPALNTWYASDGALTPAAIKRILELPGAGGAAFHLTYLNAVPASTGFYIIHALAVIVALAFACGLFTRVSGLLTLVALLAYVHRTPQVAGHVEPVLSFLLAYLCIAPSGAYLSVDQLVFGSRKKSPLLDLIVGTSTQAVAANISTRLIQVHLAMFYAMMGLGKLYGDAWWQGAALWILFAQTESRPIDGTALRRAGQLGEYALNFLTHLIVYFELAFPVLIWTRIGRPILLWVSVFAWLVIVLATGHVLLGLTMLTAGLAFVPAERFRACLGNTANATQTAAWNVPSAA